MRSPRSLVWRNLTAHPLRSTLTALAITLGVGMVLAASIVGQAASRSASELSEEGPRVDLEVFSRDGARFDEAVLDALRAYPDVEQVSPSLRVEAEGVDPEIPRLTLLGVDPAIYEDLHQPELAGGTFLDEPGSIVLPMMVAIDHGLHVGDEITLAAEEQRVTLTIGGRLKLEQDVTALAGSTTAYVPLSTAQVLAAVPGQIDHVEVALRSGADVDRAQADLAGQLGTGGSTELAAILAVARAVAGGGVALTDSMVQLGLAMVGAIMLFAAAFVIMNTFAMSVTARTQEIGALRALGMTRGCQRSGVMRMVLAEAVLMGLIGATLGVLAGIGLAWGAMWALGTLDDAAFAVPWWGVVLSVALGMAVTLIGALQPARRAGRVSPLVAMRSQRTKTKAESSWYVRHGGRAGVLVLAVLLPALAAIALILRPDFYVAMALTGIGQVGLLAAVVLLLPALVNPIARLARPGLVRWLGTAGRLATDNLGRNRLRAVLTAGALTAVLTVIITTSGLVPLILKGGLTGFFGLLNEDGMVGPDAAALVASGEWSLDNAYEKMSEMPLDPRVLQTLEPLAETGVIEIERIGFAPVPPELTALPGSPGAFVDPEIFLRIGNFDFFEGDPATAIVWMQRGRAVLLGPIPAERLGAGVGDGIPIQTPHGEVEFTVAGIGGSGTGFPVFSFADGEAYFDMAGTTWVGIVVPEGQDRDAALAQVETAIEAIEGADAGMMNLDTVATTFFEIFERLQMLLNALLLLAVVVASLGVVNTMVANVAERRREIALLRAVGATQRQVRRAVVAEAAILGLMAAIIATVVSVAFLGLFALVMTPGGTPSMGFRVSWELAANVLPIGLRDLCIAAALSLVLGPLVAALAAYYPAKQAAALDVVEATRSERVALRRMPPSRRLARRPERRRRRITRSLTWTMAWRNLGQHRLRTTLTALAVALGVAMTVAADVISSALLNSLARSEDAQKFMTGLLEQLGVMLQMVGVGITLAAGFLIFNAFAMAVTQRRRQIGGLRALGMTRRQVLRLVLLESFIVGGLGTLLGLVTGPLLGRTAIALMKVILGGDLFVFSASNPSLSSVLLATALGLSIALLSALMPAWQATRVSPLAALREKTRFLRKTGFLRYPLVGVAILLTLTVYLAVAPPGEWVEYPWDQSLAAAFVAIWMVGWGLIAPGLIDGLGRWTRGPLAARWGAVGRLMADNIRRGRGRVTLTILTLVVGLTMITGMTGFIHLTGDELVLPTLIGFERLRALIVSPFEVAEGMAAYADLERIALPPELIAELPQAVGDRARVMDEWRFVIVPELSFFSSSYFSLVADPHDVQFSGDVFFDFIEGDWETAMHLLEDDCGVLVPPMIASRNGVSVGQTFEITGKDGPVRCTLAGIGRTFVNTSIVSLAAKDEFAVTEPFLIYVVPLPGTDRDRLKADLAALLARYPGVHLMEPESMYAAQVRVFEVMPEMFNALLLLAILAAALGVVNTTMMSVAERRRELGLLRAVGATRRQVMRVVTGEAALMGAIGGGLGLVVGVGVVAIIVVTYGGNSWGVPNLDLWGAAWRSVQPALVNGLVGLFTAPFVCAGAAWLPARSLLRGSALETMEPGRQPEVRRPRKQIAMRSINFLAWRNLEQGRTRTVLSVLAVALGAAMIIAGDVIANAIFSAHQKSDTSHNVEFFAEMFDFGLTVVGVAILVAAGFLVFNAFAMAITQRKRQIGALRSLGMTRRQVMRLVLVEALLTGGIGALLGLAAGPLLGRGLIALLRWAGAVLDTTLAVFGEPSVSLSSFIIAAALGVGVTAFSVLIPARQATRISPLIALRQETASGVERMPIGRMLVGLAGLVVLSIYLVVAPPGEWALPPWDTIMSSLFTLVWLACLGLTLPALVSAIAGLARKFFSRLWGATGRLVADNLRRNRRRVILTILTLAVGLTMIVSMTGLISFIFGTLLGRMIESTVQQDGWLIAPLDVTADMMAAFGEMDLETMHVPPDLAGNVQEVVGDRAAVGEWYMVVVPELSFLPGWNSYIGDAKKLPDLGAYGFTFTEGDWKTALPIMESGCGILMTPMVARNNDVWLGDTFTVQGKDRPVECTVAGLGSHPVSGNASFISLAAIDSFGVENPTTIVVAPFPGVDCEQLDADLNALLAGYPNVWPNRVAPLMESAGGAGDSLTSVMNAMLLLAILAATLGVVNTTMMNINERQHELGLLRAVGATRRQVSAVVTGEVALMGFIGGILGLVAGTGITIVFAVTYGGNAWGVPDLNVWDAAWEATQRALSVGLFGLVAAPLISAGAAWLPVRSILRGSAIETMEPARQEKVSSCRTVAAIWRWGSIRTRFALGTTALLALVLIGLIGVVVAHARTRIEEQMHDALRTMVTWNAGMIELSLPEGAETLDFDTLQTGQTFNFDSDALLRFESLIDDMTTNGLADFTIADRDNMVLIGLDTREIGTLVPELEKVSEANVHSEREGGEWLMYATVPIRNDEGLLVGSVRLTIDAREIQDFLGRLRGTLGAIGAVIVFTGLISSWWLATPLVRATRRLAAHAGGVGRGEYTLFDRPTQRIPGAKLSLRTRLTIAMVLILVLMVSVLELVTIPIERRHVEDTLKDGLVAGAEWIGQAASESFDIELSDISPDELPTFEEVLSMTETLDLARLQELTDQMRSDDVAYTALVDEEGTIVLSDQLALIGEEAPLPSDTRIEETTWRGDDVWVASTPLRRGREGEQIGALRMAVRRNRVETFLDESRNLFQLTGLIAVLAGVLLAQAIGGAVTAPARQLAAGTRLVAAGNLNVQFDLSTNDELAMLAQAYNQMVVGLREREWLRDMFGRFVSHEVAEAIRTGKVRLEGENRVVSVLFCDIRDFTARSERSTPEEVVALLNEYLPVVVEAAHRHEGTVNKFGGDSTLVIYGAPNPLQESAYQAVLTALEMRANLNRLNERLTERGEAPIHIGVGINTGVALAGAVGPPERQEYTVIGDTVNLASRIEALNKAYPDHDVLISGWTYEALGSRRAEFEFADLGEVRIRGKVEPVQVWAVVKKT